MILRGDVVANNIKQYLKETIAAAAEAGRRPPHLVIITIGEDPASKVYVRNKLKACNEIGIQATHRVISDDIPEQEVLRYIRDCNDDINIDGIMVQLPLPAGYDERRIIDKIHPDKDVDGLTTTNIGRLRSGQKCLKPCTAQGIVDLLHYYDIPICGRDVTILGRSNIVGKPVADLLMEEGATITQCHSQTHCITPHTLYGDIIVSAIGKPKYITKSDLDYNAIVIDVGINRDESGSLCGDVDFANVVDHVDSITPVPGGIGPMTVAELMKNTVIAWKNNPYVELGVYC